MKSSTAHKFSVAMNIVFVMCLAFAANGATNVFNDAVFWFRGGKDINGDGYMQQGEFFDDLHANAASHDNHKMGMSSEYYTGLLDAFKENAVLQEEPVVFPALGTNMVKNMQVLRISNVAVDYDGKNYYFPFDIKPRSVFADNNISNAYTVVGRIRLDDDRYNRNECFLKLGYDGSTRQGMWLGFAKQTSSSYGCRRIAGYCTPNSNGNDGAFNLNLYIPTNTWVDVAVVVGNGKLRVGVAVPASLERHNNNPTIAFDETSMWTDNCPLLGDEKYRLFCRDGQTTYQQANGADQTCFIGSVQQLAIWGRALSDQEVMAAFGMPRPAIFRTGFDNGASNEFGGTRTGPAQTIDGLGSWQSIANTMKVGDTWTVNFNALRDEANLAQIFSIKSLPGSAAAQIEVELNGTPLGEGRVAADSHAFWPVATNIVHEGGNALIIRRKEGGTRDFLMDAMELGGSLGVGMVSGSSTDDGRTSPDCTATGVPSSADPNTQHWPQELQPYSGITNLHFRVWVDPDMADKASFSFETKVQSASSPTGTMTGKENFSVYINNQYITKCTTQVSASGLVWSRRFQPGGLHGGWNDFEFVCPGPYTTCHWLFDYFRFETVLPSPFGFSTPPGMKIVVR